jgi:hypothetical protein
MEIAVASAKEKKQKYYAVECINCRKQIKVPISQMQRFLPREKKAEEKGGD